jgi:hypothetical protein
VREKEQQTESNLQIQWVEEENQVFSSVVCEFDFRYFSFNYSSSFPVRCRFGNCNKIILARI